MAPANLFLSRPLFRREPIYSHKRVAATTIVSMSNSNALRNDLCDALPFACVEAAVFAGPSFSVMVAATMESDTSAAPDMFPLMSIVERTADRDDAVALYDGPRTGVADMV